jgi:hypothetical protein
MEPPPWQSAAVSSALRTSCAEAIGAERMAKAAATPNFMVILQSNENPDGREFGHEMMFICGSRDQKVRR